LIEYLSWCEESGARRLIAWNFRSRKFASKARYIAMRDAQSLPVAAVSRQSLRSCRKRPAPCVALQGPRFKDGDRPYCDASLPALIDAFSACYRFAR